MSSGENILVTGVAGFIASNFITYMVKRYPQYNFIGIDKISYCSDLRNIASIITSPNFKLYKYNILDSDKIKEIFLHHKVQIIMHFAAYTHVDLSFGNSIEFTKNNIIATHILLEYAREYNISKFIYISTDEVYGCSDNLSNERSILNPTNPYAATKAAAEHLVRSYYYSYKLPTIITRGNNVFGPQQYPDKVIPLFILRLLYDHKCQIQGTGEQKRSFLYIDDVVKAFECILNSGKIGETYNIGTDTDITIHDLARSIINIIKPEENADNWIEYIKDRNFNDTRYNISSIKLKSLGWSQQITFDEGLKLTVKWYCENRNRWENILNI